MDVRDTLGTVRTRLARGFALLLAMIPPPAGVAAYESYRISPVSPRVQAEASNVVQLLSELEIDPLNREESVLDPYTGGRRDFERNLQEIRASLEYDGTRPALEAERDGS